MSGLQMCLGKQELSKRFAIDLAHTVTAIAAATAVDSGPSGEDKGNLLHESNTAKSLLMPEIRTNTSIVWNFSMTLSIPGTLLAVLGRDLLQHCSNTCRPHGPA